MSPPSTSDHVKVIRDNRYDDHFRVTFDTRRVYSYGDLMQYLKVNRQEWFIPVITKMFFWHSKLRISFPSRTRPSTRWWKVRECLMARERTCTRTFWYPAAL